MQSKSKLDSSTIGLMVGTALFFDTLQWALTFLMMHWLATIFAYMTFWTWFLIRRVRLLTPKRVAISGGTFAAELLPLVSALPAITAMVVMTVLDVKAKEMLAKTPGGGKVAGHIEPKGDNQAERKAA